MRNRWILLATTVALLACGVQPGAAATADPKAAPVPYAPPEPSMPAAQRRAPTAKPPATAKKKLINLNAASRQELKRLPRGSDEEADRIIAGRPYNSKAFLVTNQIVSATRYGEIQKLVVAGLAGRPVVPGK